MSETETPTEAEAEPGSDAAIDAAQAAPTAPSDVPDPAAVDPQGEAQEKAKSGSAFMGVPIEILISVGKARPRVSELVKLRRDSVISLDSKIDDPVEIYVGDRLIARGELQEMEDTEGQLGVRLTEVADLTNGV